MSLDSSESKKAQRKREVEEKVIPAVASVSSGAVKPQIFVTERGLTTIRLVTKIKEQSGTGEGAVDVSP